MARDLDRRREWDREYQRKRRADPATGERMRELDRERRLREADKRSAYNREYRAKHRERLNAYLRDYYRANIDARKVYDKKRYESRWPKEVPPDGCAICHSKAPGKTRTRWLRDHDHATGLLRGVLCHNCNVGLGHFKDSPEMLEAAADYLREWKRIHADPGNVLQSYELPPRIAEPDAK